MQSFDTLFARADALRAQTPRGRYAPSPTGPLHLGNLRTALLAWLQTRLAGGRFIMRNEDLDEQRCLAGCDEAIYADLRWLGLDWDEGPDVGGPLGPYDQSERTSLYAQALARLEARGQVFECFCSRRDVREAASAPHGPWGVIYPGTCRDLSPEQARQRQQRHPNRPPSWRFHAPRGITSFCDRVAGDYAQDVRQDIGDFVVRRADDLFAYQLAVVVDDALMGVTDVLRGDDLLGSTPRQIALFEALSLPTPNFWHVPLMRDASGKRMSKRERSESLHRLRAERGLDAAGVVGLLASSVGLIEDGARLSAAELLAELDPSTFERALRAASTSEPPTA